MKKKKIIGIIFFILSLAWFTFLCYQSFLTGSKSTIESSRVTDIIVKLFPSIDDFASKFVTINEEITFSSYVRKTIGHFGSYGLLGLLNSIGFFLLFDNKKTNQIVHLSIGLILCATTEIIQLFINGRGGSFGDILLNYEGFICATLIFEVIKNIIYLYKKKDINITNVLIYIIVSLLIGLLHIFISASKELDFFANHIYYISIIIYIIISLLWLIKDLRKKHHS